MTEEKKIVGVIKAVMPAVVSIIIEKNLKLLEKELPHGLYSFSRAQHHKAEKKFLPELLADSHGMVRIGGGTGFIVDPKGIVLTNKHVISDADAEHVVILDDGRKFPAKVVSRDPVNDVAILKIEAKNLPTVPLGDGHKVQLGQTVIAIGNALGMFKNTVSVGIVSGLSRAITARENQEAPAQELRGLIQTDAAINVGNSGGPLVDLKGRAVGINAAIIAGAQNIGFAIPINAARRDLADVKKAGRILRPYLGLRYLVLDDILAHRMNQPVDYGAYVVAEGADDPGVAPGSPAARAGIEEKDIVLECDGGKVDTDHPIQDYLEEKQVGDEMELLVLRNGRTFTVRVTLTERK